MKVRQFAKLFHRFQQWYGNHTLTVAIYFPGGEKRFYDIQEVDYDGERDEVIALAAPRRE